MATTSSVGAASGIGAASGAIVATGTLVAVGVSAGVGAAGAISPATTWPASLPQLPLISEWRWKPELNKISTKPPVGPNIERRRSTARRWEYSAKFPPLTGTQVGVFELFHDVSLADGVLSYSWADPKSRVSYSWKISAYQISSTAHGKFDLAMTVTRFGPGV